MVALMDICKSKSPRNAHKDEVSRPPLVPSEKTNASAGLRRSRTREISSRYKSTPPTPLRCPSTPSLRTSPGPDSPIPKRSRSVDRTVSSPLQGVSRQLAATPKHESASDMLTSLPKGRKTSRTIGRTASDFSISSALVSSPVPSPKGRLPASDCPRIVLKKSVSNGSRTISSEGSGGEDHEYDTNACPSPITPSLRANRTLSMPIPRSPSPRRRRSPSPIRMPLSRSTSSPSQRKPSAPVPLSGSTNGRTANSSFQLADMFGFGKAKKNATHVEHGHHLRLLYNRYLQWRFINARVDASLCILDRKSEDSLYSTWNTLFELHDTIAKMKINVQQLRNEVKLDLILKQQMSYLEDWLTVENEHSSSLAGIKEALHASIVNLPVSRVTKVNVQTMKDIFLSCLHISQTTHSSVCNFLSRLEIINSLVSNLAVIEAQERAMLDECRDLLSSIEDMQVQELSLRTQLVQQQEMLKNRPQT